MRPVDEGGWGIVSEDEYKRVKSDFINELKSQPSVLGRENRWQDLAGEGHWERGKGKKKWRYVGGENLGFWDEWYSPERMGAENDALGALYDRLPDQPTPPLRQAPETEAQRALVEAMAPKGVTPAQAWQEASPELQELIIGYWYEGLELPEVADYEINQMSRYLDISPSEVLSLLGTQAYMEGQTP